MGRKIYGKGPTAAQLQKRQFDFNAAKSLALMMFDLGDIPTVDDVLFIYNESIREQYDKKDLIKLSNWLEVNCPKRDWRAKGFHSEVVGDKIVVIRINN